MTQTDDMLMNCPNCARVVIKSTSCHECGAIFVKPPLGNRPVFEAAELYPVSVALRDHAPWATVEMQEAAYAYAAIVRADYKGLPFDMDEARRLANIMTWDLFAGLSVNVMLSVQLERDWNV